MSADKFKQLSDAFLKISQGFAEVADIMSANLETPEMTSTAISTNAMSINVMGTSAMSVSDISGTVTPNTSTSTPVTTPVTAPVTNAVKKVKKEKDPLAPKRPLNAYFLFQRDFRQRSKEENPSLPFAEFTKLCNDAWESISAEEKAKYEAESKALFEEFNRQMKEYKQGESNEPKLNETPKVSEKPKTIETPSPVDLLPLTTEPVSSQSMDSAHEQGQGQGQGQGHEHEHEHESSSQEPKKKKKKNKHIPEGENRESSTKN